jgi:protein-disulfide isomerase
MPALGSIPNVDDMTTDAQRKRRLAIFAGALLAVIALVAVVIAITSDDSDSTSTTTPQKAAAPKHSEFAGIPQQGNVLGSPDAKATLMVFADMQCPFCAEFETKAFPPLVSRYVKTGKLKVIFQPISILGSESVVASRAVVAAAQQNKLFDYTSQFYANQGEENTGYVTEEFMTKIARSVRGLDVAKWKADLSAEKGTAILTQAQAAAQTAQIDSTPSFLVARGGKTLERLEVPALTADAFYGKLDALTK